MKKHTKVYLDYFGYGAEDFIGCEVCGSRAVDIHHIEARGMGGSKKLDTIENIMALCRNCHVEYGDKRQYMDNLKAVHQKKLSK